VTWKCNNCGEEKVERLFPMNWWEVKAGNWVGHLCPNCSPSIRAYIEDERRKWGE
jgi:predicted RNA-binding Zn-ribbon protein involved in translation (DUF1610 family)